MHEYLVENENIKNIQNYQNYIYQLYYKAKYLNLGSKNSSGEHGEISGCPWTCTRKESQLNFHWFLTEISFPFSNEWRQRSNLWPVESKNV